MTNDAVDTLLLGAVSLDRYSVDDTVLPGGGVLNMAWHWRRLGVPFRLLTRIGDDRPEVFLDFLRRHEIPHAPDSIIERGRSASIDIEIQPDRQPWMDNFVEGVWARYRSTAREEALIRGSGRLHVVLVEGVIAELGRLHAAGLLVDREVSADFLGFRHYTVDRFATTMAAVELGFVGWPGDLEDPTIAGLREVVRDLHRGLVVTLGSRGVLVIDGRAEVPDQFIPVAAVPVAGTTLGCGDAFIALFLAEFWRTRDLARAVERGKVGGALATAWKRPLPDDAYAAAPLAPAGPRSADEKAQEDQDEARDRDQAGGPPLAS